ncbi:Baculoviral IAP repeat-containing protein 3 [Holothuria leucospilota]|uniref:Baculoviral IAP repeat-containing protein 3 n=1 Tax=Holothuria leucospilota TaxID=206669 RepID=A0A9Q1BIW3_HOLLE|nr:Baculoviral IAP repeat-containing protein 3 [Holothuria leucospilota]
MDEYRPMDSTTSTTRLRDLPGFVYDLDTSRKMLRDRSVMEERDFEYGLNCQKGRHMNIESNRVASFKAPFWHKDFPVSIYRLANAGLYSTGRGDEVECFSCFGKISNWKNGDSPKRRHKKMYPNCRFVNGLDTRNISNVKYVPNEKYETRIIRPAINSKADHAGYLRDESTNSMKMLKDRQSKLTEATAFRLEKIRLTTFKLWPLSSPVDPYELSASGFYVINDFTVQCFACFGKISFSSWEVGDRPMNKHKVMFPSCPFVRGLETGNRPITGEEKKAVLEYEIHQSPASNEVQKMRLKFPQYESSKSRLVSFRNWTLSYVIKPTALAEAGFFYTNKSDLVTCFCCGLRLEAWNPGDDAWSEHATWSPNCAWVLEKKGRYFVKSVNAT